MIKPVTAKNVAKYCGVSQATVSYVINGNKKVSEETFLKVSQAIKELNYYPNTAARSMRKSNCIAIGLVCAKDYSRQAFLNVFEGISEYIKIVNYTITIFYEDEIIENPKYVESYFSNSINGLLFISNTEIHNLIAPAISNNIPYVVISVDGVFSSKSPTPHAFSSALTECALYCKENSLKEIRYFSVNNNGIFVNHKFPEFSNILKVLYPQSNLVHIVYNTDKREFSDLSPFFYEYAKNENFDFAISQNYDIGFAVQKALFEKNHSIPQKKKHILLNYFDFYNMCYPSLSGILIPYKEMGYYAAKLIIAVFSENENEFQYEDFVCNAIYNQTTKM